MTKNDIKMLLAMLGTVYSKNLLPTPDALTINTWEALLGDMDFDKIKAAAIKWASTEKYPPTIADLRSLATESQYGTPKPAQQAWGLLQYAVLKFGYPGEEEALSLLDPETRNIVTQFGWKYFCQMPIENESTYYAQFRNAYDSECKREKSRRQVPEFIQKQIDNMRAPESKQISSVANFKQREYTPEYLATLEANIEKEMERLEKENQEEEKVT